MDATELEKLITKTEYELDQRKRSIDNIVPLAILKVEAEKVRQLMLIHMEASDMTSTLVHAGNQLEYIANHLAALRSR